ncbi:Ribose 5-phosphate isomerase B [Leptospirillum ferriphilum]|jgi:ribose 5-phosphate isomerase B|uniref:Ribose 5-phosphate isomerase B n=2 Tax=Leptospirillum TaxID=179 RepID=A0A094WG62_9BACT|nr:ribose 5-phosphate isomerase B [Leptospirillum ferriphilum]EDZ40029.1 MAG: Ribose/galactose isomerase [Leptospirillum sp. Group II '5-way CG']KGA94657.1 Ribose 5-phosphate isomerase B [Leptospirillum ferriphilum]
MMESSQARIVIGSDHAGYPLKESLRKRLEKDGYPLLDVGTFSEESVDYPDYAEKVARALHAGEGDIGILLCGTGIGVSIAANKIRGIRAALVYNDETASLAHRHNNANVICFGGREISLEQAHTWTRLFLSASFEGGRHQRRIDEISALESPGSTGQS